MSEEVPFTRDPLRPIKPVVDARNTTFGCRASEEKQVLVDAEGTQWFKDENGEWTR